MSENSAKQETGLEKNNKTHRVFFALWPDETIRKQIVMALEQSSIDKKQGRIVESNNLHITLHFIGNVNQKKLNCLHRAAQTIKATGFSFSLDHFDYFKKPKVLWAGLKQSPESLDNLHGILGESLSECHYKVEDRAYTPHVTLMRKLPVPDQLEKIKPVDWDVKDFCLVESTSIEEGVRYKVLERYSLK